jgi:hypothetical protein
VPYRNRSNVGPTIAHPAPAAILIRHQLRLDIWGIGASISNFWRLPWAPLGYFPLRVFARKSRARNQRDAFPPAESVTSERVVGPAQASRSAY